MTAMMASAVSPRAARSRRVARLRRSPPPGVARKRWRAKGFVGSLGFAAPEVISGGARGYDPTKADAWSLGAVALEMLAGNEFFDGAWLAAYRAAPAAESIRGALGTLREDEKVRWPSAGAQEFALALLDDEPKRRCDVPRALGCRGSRAGPRCEPRASRA